MSRQDYMKEYNLNYRRSIKGLLKYIYKHQLRNCVARNHQSPTYTEEELVKWFTTSSTAMQVYTNWKNSDYNPELVPSIDRLDNTKSYTFDNIEVTTWAENKRRAYEGIRNQTIKNTTLINGGHIPVLQFSLDGIFIAEYISMSEAARATGLLHQGISDACNGKRNVYGWSYWCYKTQETQLRALFTPQLLAKNKASYIKSIGYTVEIYYTNGAIEELSVPMCAALLGTSLHNVRQLAQNKISNRSPKLPNNIIKLRLKVQNDPYTSTTGHNNTCGEGECQ